MIILGTLTVIAFFIRFKFDYLFVALFGVILPNTYCIIFLIKNYTIKDCNYIQKIQKLIMISGLIIIFIIGR